MAGEPLVTLAEAARDLLTARAAAPRHVGFRLDLWACLEAALADEPVPPPAWEAWPGGDSPVEGDGLVDVRYRNGEERPGMPASVMSWEHASPGPYEFDIVAYRLHTPE